MIAIRSDRTPPVLISRLTEIDSLGEPTSRGEAESVADHLAHEAASAQAAQELATAGTEHRAGSLSDRFIALAREAIAGITARHGEADPAFAWRRLTEDSTSNWAYADGFRQRLDVTRADLLIDYDPMKSVIHESWDVLLRRLDHSLALLIEEYQKSRR